MKILTTEVFMWVSGMLFGLGVYTLYLENNFIMTQPKEYNISITVQK